jgi:hypothetical protein
MLPLTSFCCEDQTLGRQAIKRPDGMLVEVNVKNVDDPAIEQRPHAAASLRAKSARSGVLS